MSNNFWVYVNEPNNKALIHLGPCSHCNDGQGREVEASPHNGEWFGPFGIEQAKMKAMKSGKATKRWCGFCAKALGIETEIGQN